MRTAVFALTEAGAQLARRVNLAFGGQAALFVSSRHPLDGAKTFGRLRTAVQQNFRRYDALVFIMAAGIAVRTIAPHLVSKLEDPAVVVLDEQGHHVISLLSGHVGGANRLARELAAALGAEPVITTATDVEGLVAPDALAMELGLFPEPHEAIQAVNSALLCGEPVAYYIDPRCRLADFCREALKQRGLAVCDFEAAEQDGGKQVIISPAFGEARPGRLFLRPMMLRAGVGCRKDTPKEAILAALKEAAARIGMPMEAITSLGSTTFKREEQGLHEAAAELRRPLYFYANDVLQRIIEQYGLRESDFVRQTIGIGNVCEAAALAAGGGRMALGKTRFERVTVALVWQNKEDKEKWQESQ